MQKVSELAPKESASEWIKVEDLQGKARRLTIEDVEWIQVKKFKQSPEEPDSFEHRTEIALAGTEKKYLPNKSSMYRIAEAYGDDPSAWKGKRLILKPHAWDNGKMGIWGDPADVEVEEGFGSVQETVSSLAKEFGGTTSMRVESDDDVPF